MSARVALVSVLAAAMLTLAWQRAAIPKVPPIPKAGPLAQRSPCISGRPGCRDARRDTACNAQSAEKIALGQRLFLRRSPVADGTVAAAPATIPRARSPTAGHLRRIKRLWPA